MMVSTIDRYPGIRAFERGERRVFFGRDAEASDLFDLVKTRSLVVLFAKSGIGKSSLIHAGLEPKLEENNFLPIPIRFQNTDSTPLAIMDRVIAWYLDNDKLQRFAPHEAEQQLWHKFKACTSPQPGQIPVFIFDQFEEFFNHPVEARMAFVNQLADLVENRLPEDELAKLQAIPRSERTAEQLEWYTPANVKFLIAIRSDRLSEMNEMTSALPSVLQNRFELKPLTTAQAQQAIVEPAQLDGDFSSPKFSYHPQTLNDILSNLRSKLTDEIESFQLQILCGEVEKMVRERNTENLVVTPDYLGGSEGIRNILNNYYENQMASLDDAVERPLARKLIEEQLIANNKRIGVAVETIDLPATLVEKLLLSRLIRRAPTHLGDVYEISHDTLVAPVIKSRDQRRLIERQQQIEAERRAREAELQEQKKRLEEEQQLRYAAENARAEAIQAQQYAEAALAEADLLRKKAESNARILFFTGVVCVVLLFPLVLLYVFMRSNWMRDLAEASTFRKEQKFEAARSTFQQMHDDKFYHWLLLNRSINLPDSIQLCQKMEAVEHQVRAADQLIFRGEYYEALQIYKAARDAGFAGLELKIDNSERFRQLALDNFTRKAETFFDAKALDLACEYFARAKALDPQNPYLIEKSRETQRFCQH